MQTKFPFFMLLCVPLVGQPSSVSTVAFSESKDVIPAFSSAGPITLPSVRVRLNIDYPRGQKERGAGLSVVYDPQYGHYMWMHEEPAVASGPGLIGAIKSRSDAIYADAMGLFEFDFPTGLVVKVYTGKADSLDAAETAAIKELQTGLGQFEGGAYHLDYKGVNFRKTVPNDEFRCLPLHANCQDYLSTIQVIEKQGSNWRLVLRNRWDQEVILDPQFNVISSKQLTQPSK